MSGEDKGKKRVLQMRQEMKEKTKGEKQIKGKMESIKKAKEKDEYIMKGQK